jgi:hypothetical protein
MPLSLDAEAARALVHDDVRSVFATSFPGEVLTPHPFEEDQHIASETTVVVPWQWVGRHESTFLDIPATGIDVDILGVSLLRDDGSEGVLVHRIVDWLTLYQRLGVVIGNRTTIDRSRILDESKQDSDGGRSG